MLPIISKNEHSMTEGKIVDQIRALGIDMIHEANSGHPGIVLGAAPILYTLYAHQLIANPTDPDWVNRDRFVLSAGHGSALLYATLFMAGYDLSLNDLKAFRSLSSKTPGHPEWKVTPGVEMSTGPLGQGLATAVGMAIGEAYLHSRHPLINHYTYVLCGDGDLMEGISYEAMSLAGTLKLHKLIVLYDSNQVSLDGNISSTFTEDVHARFQAAAWDTITVTNGEDVMAINKAIEKAKGSNKPTLIEVKTTIGKYSKLEGTNLVHGTPLTEEDITSIKNTMELRDVPFNVSSDAVDFFREELTKTVEKSYQKWQEEFECQTEEEQRFLTQLRDGKILLDLQNLNLDIPEDKMEAPRVTSSKILQELSLENELFLGGSADLSSSCKTYLKDAGDFSCEQNNGKNIWFGVREHLMGAIANGLALSSLRPFVSTFLVFSDYLKPAIRLACLMKLPVLYIFTHDSITVGEDGPTHQPIEQLIGLRSMPNIEVYRPMDANEVIGAYRAILNRVDGPSVLVLGRNAVPIEACTSVSSVAKGAYIVKETAKDLSAILLATGDDVEIALELQKRLLYKGIGVRVVSMPCMERFEKESEEYKEEVLPPIVKKIAIEKASSYAWYRYVYSDKYLFTLDCFGASGKKDDVLKQFGFDLDTLEKKVLDLLK